LLWRAAAAVAAAVEAYWAAFGVRALTLVMSHAGLQHSSNVYPQGGGTITRADLRWERLYRVQRRIRHVRRLSALLLNNTKGWSSLRWGKNKYATGAEYNFNSEKNKATTIDEDATHKSKLQGLKNIYHFIQACIAFLLSLIKTIIQFFTNLGSFIFGVRTVIQTGRALYLVLTYLATAKVTFDLLGIEPKTIAYGVAHLCIGYDESSH
jgi:hypothetical protein